MASDPDRTDDGPWDDLEQGFFAAAPPDVPEAPPEPMRFDDLDPVTPPRPERRGQAWRASARASAAGTWRKLAPATASAAAAWRRVAPALAVAAGISRRSAVRLAAWARGAARAGQARVPGLLSVFRDSSRQTRLLAAGVAALVAVTGVSAGVVASRGGGGGGRGLAAVSRTQPAQAAIAIREPVADPTPPSPVAMTSDPEPDPLPSSASIAPGAATPGQHKRKHAKAPARQVARAHAKVVAKAPQGPAVQGAAAR